MNCKKRAGGKSTIGQKPGGVKGGDKKGVTGPGG